jgi:hypothetical protein
MKYLNLRSSLPSHYVESGLEKYCRRWGAVNTLMSLRADEPREGKEFLRTHGIHQLGDNLFFSIQRSRFHGAYIEHDHESLCMTFAWRSRQGHYAEQDVFKSATLGCTIDERFKATVRFADDDKIRRVEVGHTCNRCPLEDCSVRAADSWILNGQRFIEERDRELNALLGRWNVTYAAATGARTK